MRSLVVGGLVTTVAGVGAVFWAIQPGTLQADLVAAGLTTDYTPRRLACLVPNPTHDPAVCPDAGPYCERRPIIAVSNAVDGQGRRDVLWPPKAVRFRDLIADVNSNCRTVQVMTWAAAQAEYTGSADPPDDPGSCACWNPGGGDCRQSDGGTTTRDGHNEFGPNDGVGAGCVPKSCGEIAGARNWPSGCAP